MPAFEWKNHLKVVVGEITRKQQMQIWREISERGLDDLDPIQQNEAITVLLAAHATRTIYRRDGKSWQPCNGHVAIEHDDVPYEFDLPVTEATFDDLPISLTNQWLSAALEANDGLEAVLNFSWLNPAATTNGSATEPAPEPSTAPPTTD